jgi:hypothetical protein
MRCAAAHVFTPTSIGCLSARQMLPRLYAATTKMLAGHIKIWVM